MWGEAVLPASALVYMGAIVVMVILGIFSLELKKTIKTIKLGDFMYSLLYFVGLVVCAASLGTLTEVPQYGFFVIGGGLILYPVFVLVIYPIVRKLTTP